MVVFSFIISTEPYKFEAVDTAINLGQAIVNKGHQILGIFLYGSGVYNLKGKIHTGDELRNLPNKLQEFCKLNNIKLVACSTWISITGIQTSEFIEGACQDGLGGLSELISNSEKIIFFGAGG